MPKKHQRIGFPTKRQTMSWSELHVKTHWHHLDESLSRNRKQNKPRCYPQQQLGNNASKENLRARLFPILPRNPWIGTCPGTSRNLPPGIRPGTAPEPILAKTPWLKLLGKNLEKSPKKLGTSPKSGKDKWVLERNTQKKKKYFQKQNAQPLFLIPSPPQKKRVLFGQFCQVRSFHQRFPSSQGSDQFWREPFPSMSRSFSPYMTAMTQGLENHIRFRLGTI